MGGWGRGEGQHSTDQGKDGGEGNIRWRGTLPK